MGIHTDTRKILYLFNTSTEVFQIPIYQRGYSWDIDQWNELWDDISLLKEEDIHFLGTIVVISNPHKPGLNYFELVDGQQRLTTLLILLIALKNFYSEKGEKEPADYLDKLLFSSYIKIKSSKLITGKFDAKDFTALVSNKKEELNKKGNISRAYNFFMEKIKKHEDIDALREILLNNVELVQITTDNSLDAFRLFETLNDRGLNLSALDLIKNYLLRKISENLEDKLEDSIKLWDNIISNLEGIDKILFIRQYFLASEGIKVSRSKLYDKYQEKINKKDYYSFLEELSKASEIYSNIVNQETDNDELNTYLKSLKSIEATTSYTVILKLLLDDMPPKEIIKIIKLLQAFSLRISICKASTSDMESVYLEAINNYKSKDNPVNFIKDLFKKNSPNDIEFQNNFKKNNFRQNDQTKYILECLEDERTNETKEKILCDRTQVHIEHIMPFTITTKKSKKELGDWEVYLGEDKEKHSDFVSKIGNLTLLGAKLNISASNNPFEAKKKNYNDSNIMITKDLCSFQDWKLKEIEGRSEKLSEKAVKIWSFN
jgi:uncharacterized protein with ParB-like and HNH nuclease domain